MTYLACSERQLREGSHREAELSSRLEAWAAACGGFEGERNSLAHQVSALLAEKAHLEQQVCRR